MNFLRPIILLNCCPSVCEMDYSKWLFWMINMRKYFQNSKPKLNDHKL